MKNGNYRALWAFALFAAIVILGCGGGGGGTTGTTGTTGTAGAPFAGQYLEFFRSFQMVDPMNVLVGDNLQIQVVNYDAVGTRTVLGGTGHSLSGPGAGAATVSGSNMTINTLPSGVITVSVNTTVAGQPKTVSANVFAPSGLNTTRVAGLMFSTNGTTPMGYVEVQFLDASASFVGGARVAANGVFSGHVPTSAKFLIARPATIPSAFYASLKYQGNIYAVTGSSCLLPLPALTPGTTNTMPSTVFVPRQIEGPPPPPSGC